MATVALTESNFEEVIRANSLVIVDFWAPWCGPCRAFAPVFEKAAETHAGVTFAKVNTEEEQSLAASFNIRSIPTLMVFRDQIILYAEPGALPPQALDEVVRQAQALDMDEVRKEIAAQQPNSAPPAQ